MIFSTNYIETNALNYSIESSCRHVTPIPNSIIFTEEELKARDKTIAEEAWDAGQKRRAWIYHGDAERPEAPNKEEYINSLKL